VPIISAAGLGCWATMRPTMKFVATKSADQLDLQALQRVRERLVGQRTGIINQIRAFLLERGVAVRQGRRFLHTELPGILATRCEVLSARMVRLIEDLAGDWRRLDERIEGLSGEIAALARQDAGCERLMSVPGIGPIISSAMVAAIGAGDSLAVPASIIAQVLVSPRRARQPRQNRGGLWTPQSSCTLKCIVAVCTVREAPFSADVICVGVPKLVLCAYL
jgi:transposase